MIQHVYLGGEVGSSVKVCPCLLALGDRQNGADAEGEQAGAHAHTRHPKRSCVRRAGGVS